jgi:hypothetical protein
MQTTAEFNALLFQAFLLGKHLALEAFNVEAAAADDATYNMVREVAEGKRTTHPDIEQMLLIVRDDEKDLWRKRLESHKTARDAEEREIAKAVVNGMDAFFRVKRAPTSADDS